MKKESNLSVKAVVFDYGQVISLPQDPKVIDYIAGRIGVERKRFHTVLWSLRNEYDRGTQTSREYYDTVLSHLGVSMDDKTINELIEADLMSWKNINAETVVLMEDVKKAGYQLGILSNMPGDFLAWARKNLPVFSLPQINLFSCEINLVKPEKEIYEKLISVCGAKPEEIVFFDDKPENVHGAASLGIKAFMWKDPSGARRELSALGVAL